MSVYKVPQDVEAEDKLVGPFTLKQFIFLIVAAISGWLTFVLGSQNIILILIPLSFTIIFGILGIYRRPDQPVEIYLMSLLNFYLKPRRRIWSQDGILETVSITAPPKIERRYTDGRTKSQVQSQLRSLASVMDTRGWAVKNPSLQVPYNNVDTSDRIVTSQDLPQMQQPVEVHAADDMLDDRTNYVAQNFGQMVQTTSSQLRQQAITNMQQAAQDPAGSNQPIQPVATQTTSAAPANSYAAEPAFSPYPDDMQQHVVGAPAKRPAKTEIKQTISSMPQEPSPDIIRLAQNSDLSVSALARQAQEAEQSFEDNQEISLH